MSALVAAQALSRVCLCTIDIIVFCARVQADPTVRVDAGLGYIASIAIPEL